MYIYIYMFNLINSIFYTYMRYNTIGNISDTVQYILSYIIIYTIIYYHIIYYHISSYIIIYCV